MRVLVDTSVWVDFFNGHSSPEADALERLIREEAEVVTCGLVVAEILQGIRQPKSLASISRHFREMDWLTPREPETYVEAADLYRSLRSRGLTIRGTIDCIIARLANENDVLLLAKDRDLRVIADSRLCDLKLFPVQ